MDDFTKRDSSGDEDELEEDFFPDDDLEAMDDSEDTIEESPGLFKDDERQSEQTVFEGTSDDSYDSESESFEADDYAMWHEDYQEAKAGTKHNDKSMVQSEEFGKSSSPESIVASTKRDSWWIKILDTVAMAILFGVIAAGVFIGVNRYVGSDSEVVYSVNSEHTGYASDLNDIADIAETAMPSLVAVTNMYSYTYSGGLFGGFAQTQEVTSLGSGIIIAADSDYLYICTNNHVVSGAETLTVQFIDDSVLSAEIAGTDPADDLAVIKVELNSMTEGTLDTIRIASVNNSDELRVGEGVIAIGNALGYGQSVTTGVISALGRELTVSDESTGEMIVSSNLIQTDAAINAGNSGGALLNADGEVIGINSAKYSGEGVEGMGYAIPMSDAYDIIMSLINGEEIPAGAFLGISGQTVSTDVSEVYGIPQGVLIVEVMDNSAAEEAGLVSGDIITELNREPIASIEELQEGLASYREGDVISLTVAKQNTGYGEIRMSVPLGGKE